MSATERKDNATCRTKAPFLQLVPKFSNRDAEDARETAAAFREMADMAERGEIIGLAYVVLRPNRRVTIGNVGATTHEPSLVTHWLQKLTLHFLK